MENEKDLATRVAEKEAEILHYKGVLERYRAGRWMNQGKRHLADLEQELKELQNGKLHER